MTDIIAAEVVEEEPRPWGFWATLGLSLLILLAFVAIQMGSLVAFLVAGKLADPSLDVEATAKQLESHGLLLSVATFASALPCLGLIFLFAWVRRGWSVPRYLALKRVSWRVLLCWLLLFVVFLGCTEALSHLLGRTFPEFMINAYQTAGFLPLLWTAVIVVAPLFEEVFFRGFLFRGIEAARFGAAGATVVSALVWAGIHLQYEAYEVTLIFAIGLIFGIARARTGSLYPPLAMHAFMNLASTLQVMFHLAGQ